MILSIDNFTFLLFIEPDKVRKILCEELCASQAIIELQALEPNHPYRQATLELIFNLRENLKINQRQLDIEDRELIMRLEPLYQQDREQAKQEGGQEVGQKIVENLLQVRFGTLDDQLTAIIQPVLTLPPSEFTPLLMHLSKEELIARFGSQV